MRLLLVTCFFLWGCGASEQTTRPASPGDPADWNTLRVRQHLAYLNSSQTEGRAPTSRGAARTAQYLADRLFEAGYQPVRSGEYRTLQSVSLWTLEGASLVVMDRDTLQFEPGVDFLVDARSAQAARSIRDYGPVMLRDSVVLGTRSPLAPDVPLVYPLNPLRDALGWTREGGRRVTGPTPGQIRLDIRKTGHPAASIVQVGGLLPGRDVVSRDSLVVLIAPYDGSGLQGSDLWTDGGDMGFAASALLEVAARSADVQKKWKIFGSTVMVVFVSGTRFGCQGMDAWLRVIPWDRTMISDIVVVPDGPRYDRAHCANYRPNMSARIHAAIKSEYGPNVLSERLYGARGGVMRRSELLRGDGIRDASAMALELSRSLYGILLERAALAPEES